MTDHGLFIPVEGIPEVLHSDLPIDGRRFIRARQETGAVVSFPIDVDGERDCELTFLVGTVDEPLPENVRAREILHAVTSVHMKITGPAVFLGLAHDRVHEILVGIN